MAMTADAQTIAALACVFVATASLARRAWRLTRGKTSRGSCAIGGACHGCPSAVNSPGHTRELPLVSLESPRDDRKG